MHVIRVRLDVITSEKECKLNKDDYKKHIVKVKKPKRRKKRGHGWSQKGSKDTRRTKPLKRVADPDYSEKTLKVKKPNRRKKRGHGWSQKGSKDSRRRKSLKSDVEPDSTVVPITNYYFTTRRIGPYSGCYVPRASECELPQKLGEFITQLVDWFFGNGGRFDTMEDSSCDCPHCPYSTGSHHMQRVLLLQRWSQLHHFS